MRISISNIAWDAAEDDAVAELLMAEGVSRIDVAPAKYFADVATTTDAQAESVRRTWERRGFAICGMQALLFGTQGLNLFAEAAVQQRMLEHLGHVCRLGGALGAGPLVFGSPRNRDRGALSTEESDAVAVPFFRRLGELAARYGTVICLEPNPPLYGANYLITAEETARVTALVDHPAIRMQFDTGALAMSGEDPAAFMARSGQLVGHVHASEPNLLCLGDRGAEVGTDHAAMAAAVRAHRPELTVAIEMRATDNEPHLQSIARAVQLTRAHYAA